MDNLTRAILLRAAEYVDKGWCQGRLSEDAQGNAASPSSAHGRAWCALGAIWRTAVEAEESRLLANGAYLCAIEAVAERISARRESWPNPGDGIVAWNDAAERTQHEVAETLRAVAWEG